jgi:hypothetical protein
VTYPNTGDTVLGIGLVVKQGSAGNGSPSGIYIDRYQVEEFPNSASKAMTLPFGGNLIVGMLRSGTVNPVTLISDAACSWEHRSRHC